MSRQALLSEFIARCDPSALPPEGTYVPRVPDFATRLAVELQPSERSRVLLFGQTGVGKSTELARLEELLRERYLVIRPPVDRVLDLKGVSWHELLVFSAAWAAENAGSLVEPVRQDIQAKPAQLWDMAVSAIRAMEQRFSKPAVLIWDGFEKMPLDGASKLFLDNRCLIGELPCRAVITAPLALSFQCYFKDIEGCFCTVEQLRALPCDDGAAGHDFLSRLAAARGTSQVFTRALLDEAVRLSGGLPRQLLQVLSTAAMQALIDGQEQVQPESLARAIQRNAERWQYQIEPVDHDKLRGHAASHSTRANEWLLRTAALVEYELPAGRWCAVTNPLVDYLLRIGNQERNISIHHRNLSQQASPA